MQLPRIERNLEVYLNNETFKDIVAAHLYSMGFLKDAEVVLNVIIGEPKDSLRAVKISYIEEKAVEAIVHK